MTTGGQASGKSGRLDGKSGAAPASAFPDISGEWAMDIHWQRGEGDGIVPATAIIRQDSAGISMEVHSKGSDSHALIAQAGREGPGSPVLYYLFEVEPKALGSDADGPYKGAAVLRFYPDSDELRGNYWTSQLSKGHFNLRRKTGFRKEDAVNKTVDVVLITAIPEEFEAAKRVFSAASHESD